MKHHNYSANDGFTLTEALAALLVISLAGLSLMGFVVSSMTISARSRDTLRISAALIEADRIIRERAAAVAIPYWEQQGNITENGFSVALPWYGGVREQYLTFALEGGALVIETRGAEVAGEREVLLAQTALGVSGISLLRDSGGAPRGIDITYAYRDKPGRTLFSGNDVGAVHTAASFGSAPLIREEP